MKKILIIEDEKFLAEMYRDKFVQEGFEVISAFSAEEGLEILQKEIPGLILLDILLPVDNGVSFYTKMKKNSKFALIPTIAFSNYNDPKIKEQALELGMKDYLIKTGHTPQEIIEKIESYLK